LGKGGIKNGRQYCFAAEVQTTYKIKESKASYRKYGYHKIKWGINKTIADYNCDYKRVVRHANMTFNQ